MSALTRTGVFVAIIAALIAALLLTRGGEDDGATALAADTDGAFLAELVPHHEGAIEMARIARSEADHQQVTRLADSIVASQGEEIERLDSIHRRLYGAPVGGVDHGSLGDLRRAVDPQLALQVTHRQVGQVEGALIGSGQVGRQLGVRGQSG